MVGLEVHYLAYGTTQRGFAHHRRFGDLLGEPVARCRTVAAHAVVVPLRAVCSNPGCSYVHRMAVLVPGFDPLRAEGDLFALSDEALAELDRLELAGPYVREAVAVVALDGATTFDAQAYVAREPDRWRALVAAGEAEALTTYPRELAAEATFKPCCVRRPGHAPPHDVIDPLAPVASYARAGTRRAHRRPQRTTLPARLFGPDRVDVAYEPWRALVPTELRLGPDANAPVVLDDSGEPVGLAAGQHLGRQSTRNPDCLDRPPLRAAVGGYVWGYCMPPATRKSGWMRLADLAVDPAFDGLACGPARADFDRRRPRACGGHCDGRPLTRLSAASGWAEVEARDLYLRYAPRSTAFRYLVARDRVRLLAYWELRAGWLGVEVTSALWASERTRGWVLASCLR